MLVECCELLVDIARNEQYIYIYIYACVCVYIYTVIPRLTSDPANEFFG